MIGIPSVDAIHYTREPMNRDLFVQQTSSCGVLSLCFDEQWFMKQIVLQQNGRASGQSLKNGIPILVLGPK